MKKIENISKFLRKIKGNKGTVPLFCVILASCAPAPIIRATRAGDDAAIQKNIERGDNVNGLYHAQDLRWCWIPVIGFLGYPGIIMCPVTQLTDKTTPLIIAVVEDRVATVQFLINHGADVNAPGKYLNPHFGGNPLVATPLIYASSEGYVDIVKILLDHNADVNAKDQNSGGTALMWAAWGHKADVVKLLLARGANVRAVCDHCLIDKTALEWARGSDVKSLLLDALRRGRGPSVATQENSAGPIFKAARNGDDDRVRALIHQGVDINATDSYGFTPLMWAAYEGQTDTAEILLKAGAHLTMTNRDGDNALIIAADKGHLDIVQLLFKHGSPLNERDEKGQTALLWAEKRRHGDVVNFLKKHGARAPRVAGRAKSEPKKEKTRLDAPPKSEGRADVQSILP